MVGHQNDRIQDSTAIHHAAAKAKEKIRLNFYRWFANAINVDTTRYNVGIAGGTYSS